MTLNMPIADGWDKSQFLGSTLDVSHGMESTVGCTVQLGALRKSIECGDDETAKLERERLAERELIRGIFKEWDRDGNGTISREELTNVMRSFGHMTDADIDILMEEADRNKDGIIEYAEFVEWLTQPATTSEGRAVMDYSAALKPIFNAYDRSGQGSINYEDFEECHGILRGALRLYPDDDEDEPCDPMVLQKEAEEAFKKADRNVDQSISFLDFVVWMRDSIKESGLDIEEFSALTSKLAETLTKARKIVEGAEAGTDGTDYTPLLEQVLKSLADATRNFHDELAEEPPPISAGMDGWTEPPVGISVERLKKAHMARAPLRMKNVTKVEFEVICVPIKGYEDKPSSRVWLAEVERKVLYRNGKTILERPAYYYYQRKTFKWWPLTSSQEIEEDTGMVGCCPEFEASLKALPEEIALFCMLKTEADFGKKLDWAGILKVLENGQDYEIITLEECDQYVRHMEGVVLSMMRHEDMVADHASEEQTMRHVREFLDKEVELRPREVMATLSELKIMKVNQLWKSFTKKR